MLDGAAVFRTSLQDSFLGHDLETSSGFCSRGADLSPHGESLRQESDPTTNYCEWNYHRALHCLYYY